MLASIEIKNFRCFENTNIQGFGRINLVTGKNNSGKTCLLEALYANTTKHFNDIIHNSRSSNRDSAAQNNLFYNGSLKNEISIKCEIEKIYLVSNRIVLYNGVTEYEIGFDGTCEIQLIFDKNRQLPATKIELVPLFDNAEITGKKQDIIDAIQVIDDTIEDIRTYSSKPNVLYVKCQNENFYKPIYYFGDAVQTILRYIVNVISFNTDTKLKVLLIDEIENGIHYTAQAKFWQMLFKLCIRFDIQVFATTHSLEMIKAFRQVSKNFENEAAYFELARNASTGQIVGIKHELSTLEYELQTESPIRGE